MSLALDDVAKERVAALDAHLKKGFDQYKSVLKAKQWRDTLKDEGFITAKQRFRDGMVTTPVSSADGETVTPDALTKGAAVTAQLQLRYIYAVSGFGGLTWDVLKVRVDKPGETDMAFV